MSLILGKWNEARKLGHVLTCEVGLIVERDPDTVRGADVVYYSYERLPAAMDPAGFCDIAPNLVVEVVGEGQVWGDMVDKTGEYLRMGVDRVWVIDPRVRKVHIFRLESQPVILGMDDTLADEEVLPGFACNVTDIFSA